LTDAISILVDSESVEACSMVGKRHDSVSKEGHMLVNSEYGSRRHVVGSTLKDAVAVFSKSNVDLSMSSLINENKC
jgi:UTP-glucose-1-phosphate uridylyltransferase